jgi:hypothetical protein
MAELTDKLPFKLSPRDTSCLSRVIRALNARCDTEDMDEAQSTTGKPPAYQPFLVARSGHLPVAIILTLCLEHSALQSTPQECESFTPGNTVLPEGMTLDETAANCARYARLARQPLILETDASHRALHRSPQAWSTYSDTRASIGWSLPPFGLILSDSSFQLNNVISSDVDGRKVGHHIVLPDPQA